MSPNPQPIGMKMSVRPWEAALLTVVSLVMVLAHMRAFTSFSPFDEATLIDYVLSIADLEVPRIGAPYREETLRSWACRGFFRDTVELPPCDSAYFDHTQFPGAGVQRNVTPPLYYIVTAFVSQPFVAITGASAVAMARLTGVLFLSIGLISVVEMARRLGAGRRTSLLIAAVVPFGLPTVLHATATVNSDAAVFAMGGVIIVAVLAALNREIPLWSLVVVGVVAGLTKQTALFPIGAGALLMLGATLWPNRALPDRDRRRQIIAALAMPVAATFSFLAWVVYAKSQTPDDYVNPIGTGGSRYTAGSPVDEILRNPLDLMLPTELNFVPEAIRSAWQYPWSQVLGVFVIAAAAVAVIEPARRRPGASRPDLLRWAGWGLLLTGALSATAIQVYLALGRGTYFPQIPARYSIGMIPLALALVSVLLSSRPGKASNAVIAFLITGSILAGSSSLLL